MIIEEAIARVQSLYSKGVESDDSRLRPRHIYNKLVSMRSKLMFQKANKRQPFSRWSYVVLACVEVVEAPQTECPCLPDLGCLFYRSKYPIPEPIHGLYGPLIKPISTLDGSQHFSLVQWESAKYSKSNRYTSKYSNYYFRDGYIYFSAPIDYKVVVVSLIPKDPAEAHMFKGYCSTQTDYCGNDISVADCTPIYKYDFAIDADLEDDCIIMSSQELIQSFSQMIEDKTNNNSDSNIQRSK